MTESPATGAPARRRLLSGIGPQLYLRLGLSLVLILCASAIGVRALQDVITLKHRIVEQTYPKLHTALQLSEGASGLLIAVHHAVAPLPELPPAGSAASPDAAGDLLDPTLDFDLEESRRRMGVALARAEKTIPGSPDVASISALVERLDTIVDRVRGSTASTDDAIALHALEYELFLAIEWVGVGAIGEARRLSRQTSEALDRTLWTFVALNLFGCAVLALSVWFFVRRRLLARLESLSASMRRIAGGDLAIPIAIGGDDELADMSRALDVFREDALEVQRLNLVEKLSMQLREKNEALEATIGDLERAQDRIVHQEKLAALGQLTAGVAHEIQNPLNFIKNFSIGSTQLVDELTEIIDARRDAAGGEAAGETDEEAAGKADAEAVGKADEVKEITDEIKDSLARVVQHSKRADGIVKAMLAHSRSSSGHKEEIDVNAVLAEYANLAYHSQRAGDRNFNLTITKALDEDTGTVKAVAQDIGRVFLNLVQNACQATAERAAREDAPYEPELRLATQRTATAIEIRIGDNGGGIPEAVRAKMFEPFFTTKTGAAGTGLGLSISNDIVRAHGGSIEVTCEEGESSEFTVSLPIGS